MKYDARLIQKRHAQPRSKRIFWGGVTAIFWLFYVYLWMPVITFAMWLLGINNAIVQLYVRKGAIDAYILLMLPAISLCCTVLVTGWVHYNRMRYSGNDRRSAPPQVTQEMIAFALGANDETAAHLRKGKLMTLVMNDEARPVRVIDHTLEPPYSAMTPVIEN